MISVEKIEAMAPDQASLDAARKLLDGKKWPSSHISPEHEFIWGECQGSGSTPYRSCASLKDFGYKCTCPSRKFPCKHTLALLWRYNQKPQEFTAEEIPQWVNDWSGRRRTGTASAATPQADTRKNILAAVEVETDQTARNDSKKTATAKENNQKQREKAILSGLEDFTFWLSDIFDNGLLAFMQNCTQQCQQAAKRLVDAKASGLAVQVDELASDILQIAEADKLRYVSQKLSAFYLLAKAYPQQHALPVLLRQDARRLIGWTMTREQLLQAEDAERQTGDWLIIAQREHFQNDGLRRIETWIRQINADSHRFAVLIDYYHASMGAVVSPFHAGETLSGTVVYFPSATPLRAMLADYRLADNRSTYRVGGSPLASALAQRLSQRTRNPWLANWPMAVSRAKIIQTADGQFWLNEGNSFIPLSSPDRKALLTLAGVELTEASVTWDGWRADLLHAETPYGFWSA